MGLAGRKIKQRISADPRNLAWADDASKFGSSYLSKFGWDSSKGLGIDGEGRTSHIKVAQKLDLLGIGAAHQKDPNGMAWKQNQDFESVLKRLNETAAETGPSDTDQEGGKDKPGVEDTAPTEQKGEEEVLKEKKKRKDNKGGSKTKGRMPKVVRNQPIGSIEGSCLPYTSEQALLSKTKNIQRYRAHRPGAIAAKSVRSKSEASIAEILGVSRTPYHSALDPTTPTGSDLGDNGLLEKITTSSKNVADYFKEKIISKSGSNTTAPADDSGDIPKVGLGLGYGATRLRMESYLGSGFAQTLHSPLLYSAPSGIAVADDRVEGEAMTDTQNIEPSNSKETGKYKRRKGVAEDDRSLRKEKDKKRKPQDRERTSPKEKKARRYSQQE